MKTQSYFIQYSFLFFLIGLLSACEGAFDQVVDVDVPEHQPKLVLYSTLEPESAFIASISNSVGILSSDNPEVIDNAQVEIYREDELLTTLQNNGGGFYFSESEDIFPEVGVNYTIKASATGFETVESTTQVIAPISISLAQVTDSSFFNNELDGVEVAEVLIQFKDDINAENFYGLQLFSVQGEFFQQIDFGASDPSIGGNGGGGFFADESSFNYNGGVLFDDVIFNGTTKSLRVYVDTYYLEGNQELYVNLRHLSKDYYLHEQSSRLQNETGENPFGSPAFVYSNITNGFGMFGSTNFSYTQVQPK